MLVSFKRSTRRACVLVLNVWCFVLHSSKSRNGLLLILKCKAKTAWTLHPNCRPLLSSASAPGSGPRSQHCLGLRWQMQTVLWPRNNLTDHCLETCLLQIKVLCIMTQHGPGSALLCDYMIWASCVSRGTVVRIYHTSRGPWGLRDTQLWHTKN